MKSNYVLSVFGVSFFEVLQYGVPTVVYSPYAGKDDLELAALEEERVAVVAKDACTAILYLIDLMDNVKLAKACSQTALTKLSVNGAQKLSEAVCTLAEV